MIKTIILVNAILLFVIAFFFAGKGIYHAYKKDHDFVHDTKWHEYRMVEARGVYKDMILLAWIVYIVALLS